MDYTTVDKGIFSEDTYSAENDDDSFVNPTVPIPLSTKQRRQLNVQCQRILLVLLEGTGMDAMTGEPSHAAVRVHSHLLDAIDTDAVCANLEAVHNDIEEKGEDKALRSKIFGTSPESRLILEEALLYYILLTTLAEGPDGAADADDSAWLR